MINFQTVPIEPQPGFMQHSFIIMIGLMVLVLWLFMWRPEKQNDVSSTTVMQSYHHGRNPFIGNNW